MRHSLSLMRSPGSSVVAPSAAGLATDLFAAAYYARPPDRRDVADLRLARGILNTRWERTGRRLSLRDLPALHRAFGGLRLGRAGGRLGTLHRDALMRGAARLIGPWFPAAWEDDGRRAYGIAFDSRRAREAFVPERRLEVALLRRLTAPRKPPEKQDWHTYDPVELADPEAAIELLTTPLRWPDFASDLGCFTPMYKGGLDGQSFEVELAMSAAPRAPAWLRCYVTVMRVLTGDEADEYARWCEQFVDGRVVERGRALAVLELATHQGHPLGRAISRLIVGEGWIRDVGSWEPLGFSVQQLGYRLQGREAQRQFWSRESPEGSMLAQLAQFAQVAAGSGR